MERKSFYIDVDKCSGCSLCIIACKDEHVANAYAPWTRPQPATGQFWIDVKAVERGRTPRVKMDYLPVHCQHCSNAPCIKACPETAIKARGDGLVWIDPARCTGCGLCSKACPYDVIFLNTEIGIAQKCTGCVHRVDDGLVPRCVDVCPHQAIVFGSDAGAGRNGAETYHPEYMTEPTVRWHGLPKPWITGTVIDASADEVLANAVVTVVDLSDDRAIEIDTDSFGDFWLKNLSKDRTYRIEIKKAGYRSFSTAVTTRSDQDLGTVRMQRNE